jgi:hypothetical protein
MKDEAIKALLREMYKALTAINDDRLPFDGDDFHEALRLGEAAIAQPAQEPVAWMQADHEHISLLEDVYHTIPLYIAPPKREWVGLTDEEVYKIAFSLQGEHWRKVADAIEAKLKEKNNAPSA